MCQRKRQANDSSEQTTAVTTATSATTTCTSSPVEPTDSFQKEWLALVKESQVIMAPKPAPAATPVEKDAKDPPEKDPVPPKGSPSGEEYSTVLASPCPVVCQHVKCLCAVIPRQMDWTKVKTPQMKKTWFYFVMLNLSLDFHAQEHGVTLTNSLIGIGYSNMKLDFQSFLAGAVQQCMPMKLHHIFMGNHRSLREEPLSEELFLNGNFAVLFLYLGHTQKAVFPF